MNLINRKIKERYFFEINEIGINTNRGVKTMWATYFSVASCILFVIMAIMGIGCFLREVFLHSKLHGRLFAIAMVIMLILGVAGTVGLIIQDHSKHRNDHKIEKVDK